MPEPRVAARLQAVVPVGLRGTATLVWGADELRSRLLSWASTSFGGLDQASYDRLEEQAQLAAGNYVLRCTLHRLPLRRDRLGAGRGPVDAAGRGLPRR